MAVVVTMASLLLGTGMAGAHTQKGVSYSRCTSGTTVRTDEGRVCGRMSKAVTSYRGIPYAAPPVGKLRWRRPQRHKPWRQMLHATKRGPECPQQVPAGESPPKMSENCLFLKVEKPADAKAGQHLPVMVEFHGGGFVGEAPTDNGSNLVRHGHVIYVYADYRLGILGFLAHKELGRHSGDYGLQDQQAALRWVQRNIARFGGDRSNVTIFGESAGGASVCDQMASPTARGLFQRGISVSGFYNNGANTIWPKADCKSHYYTEEQAQKAGARFAAKVGCGHASDAAGCLRRISAAKLVKAGGTALRPRAGGTVGPIVNGTTLTRSPAQAFASGHVNHAALMLDVGADEFNGGVYQNLPGMQKVVANSPAEYRRLVAQQFGRRARAVERRYPLQRFPQPAPFIAYRTIMADAFNVCPALRTDRALSRHIPVYADVDNDHSLRLGKVHQPLGAFHSGTNRLVHAAARKLSPDQEVLQHQLLSEWTSFARRGDPTAAGTPQWSRYRAGSPKVMSLRPAGTSSVVAAAMLARQHHCGFWNNVTAGMEGKTSAAPGPPGAPGRGGPSTGGGATAGGDHAGIAAIGAALILAGGAIGGLVYRRRPAS
jgi:para-nitrobenzyl esterase